MPATSFRSAAEGRRETIRLAQFTGTAADITAVRTYTSKTGIAANLEQQIIPNVGVFARAGWTRGLLEPDAFTDADRSLLGGASLSGKLWGRPIVEGVRVIRTELDSLIKVTNRFVVLRFEPIGDATVVIGRGKPV
jgi:hypothetical protein